MHYFKLVASDPQLPVMREALEQRKPYTWPSCPPRTYALFSIEHIESHSTNYHQIECVEITPLRELRMWHWSQAMHARARERQHAVAAERWEAAHPGKRCSSSRRQSKANGKVADFHIKCVQALNDVKELHDTTAEKDCHALSR